LGYLSDRGLVLAGRSKLVIKCKGFQVHPAQIEQHFAEASGVAAWGAGGQPHDLCGEAIVLFVAPKTGQELRRSRLEEHAQEIASYMRPMHYVLLEAGGMPLNRVGKTDYQRLKQMAAAEAARLKSLGQWIAS
jgi:acyl-CoA synthetase (AMP-forming)/AMP-acid ligase II